LYFIFACECAKMFAGAQRDSVRLGAGITPHAAAHPRSPFFKNSSTLFMGCKKTCSTFLVCAQQGLSMPRERAQAAPLAVDASASCSKADTWAIASSAARGTLDAAASAACMSSPRLLSLGESCGDTRRHVSPLTWQPTPSGSPPPAPSTIPLELPTDLSLRSLSLCAGPSAESTPLGVLAPQISCAAPRRARPGRPSCLIACSQPAGGVSGLPCAATSLLTLAARHVSAQAKRSFLLPPPKW
jgi:hypothetical protein